MEITIQYFVIPIAFAVNSLDMNKTSSSGTQQKYPPVEA